MEFGSLNLGTQTQAPSSQSGGATPAQSATLETNPENVVTPPPQNGAAGNDLRGDTGGRGPGGNEDQEAPTTELVSTRRTTLNFDSEQNRIFLEVVDTSTEEVVERIPSENLVALVEQALPQLDSVGPADTDGSEDSNSAS